MDWRQVVKEIFQMFCTFKHNFIHVILDNSKKAKIKTTRMSL